MQGAPPTSGHGNTAGPGSSPPGPDRSGPAKQAGSAERGQSRHPARSYSRAGRPSGAAGPTCKRDLARGVGQAQRDEQRHAPPLGHLEDAPCAGRAAACAGAQAAQDRQRAQQGPARALAALPDEQALQAEADDEACQQAGDRGDIQVPGGGALAGHVIYGLAGDCDEHNPRCGPACRLCFRPAGHLQSEAAGACARPAQSKQTAALKHLCGRQLRISRGSQHRPTRCAR